MLWLCTHKNDLDRIEAHLAAMHSIGLTPRVDTFEQGGVTVAPHQLGVYYLSAAALSSTSLPAVTECLRAANPRSALIVSLDSIELPPALAERLHGVTWLSGAEVGADELLRRTTRSVLELPRSAAGHHGADSRRRGRRHHDAAPGAGDHARRHRISGAAGLPGTGVDRPRRQLPDTARLELRVAPARLFSFELGRLSLP